MSKKVKVKTRKSVTRRFRITKTGKVMRRRGNTGHLKANKSKRRIRRLRKDVQTHDTFAKRVKKAVGAKNRN